MLFKSPVYSQASGSIAGITYSRNRGGLYTRSRAIPTDPNSAQQQAVRTAMTYAAAFWSNILTAAQRTAWDTYADNVTVPNRLGDQIKLSGQQHFSRSNIPRLQFNVAPVLDGPTIYNLGEFTPVTSSDASVASQDFQIDYEDTDAWLDEDLSYMFAWSSDSIDLARAYFRGPYRAAGSLEGDSITPPTSPATFDSPFVLVLGKNCHIRIRISRADGRLSAQQIIAPTVIVA